MTGVGKEDWNELIRILKETEDSITAMGVGDFDKELARSRQFLQTFSANAGTLGLGQLQLAGVEMDKYLDVEVGPGKNKDAAAVLGFAISMLTDQMKTSNGSGPSSIDLTEAFDMLG